MDNQKMYYIRNEGFCGNALFWWSLNGKGYTTDIRKAQKYTYEEAKNKKRPEDTSYECEYIDNLTESHKLIIDSQYVDYSKALAKEEEKV